MQLPGLLRLHAPEKECLTVLDFVGQEHRKYRMDTRLKALLPKHRHSIDKEVENNFPHLPAGSAIQFDKLSRKYVLDNIRANLQKLAAQVPERFQPFTSESGRTSISAMRVKGPSRWCGSCGIPCRWRCLRKISGAGDRVRTLKPEAGQESRY